MRPVTADSAFGPEPYLEARVLGPQSEPLSHADLRRLFPGSSLTQERLDRLRDCPRMLVVCGETIVAVATCLRTDHEFRVPEIGLASPCGCPLHDVLRSLVEALEVACLAGGCRRISVSPPRPALPFFDQYGYRRVTDRNGGFWVQKNID